MSILLYYIFVVATVVQIGYWIFVFGRLALYKDEHDATASDTEEPVSVIICAKNEEANLEKNLDRILTQQYRFFEVIVVNDNSTDRTAEVLAKYQDKYPILRVVNLKEKPKGIVGKKYALKHGIKAAKHDLLLMTDADCQPVSNNWIQLMQAKIRKPKLIGLAFSPYLQEAGFLNLFIRFETVYTALQYFSFNLIGLPYMGVGRNLIYRKSLYKDGSGFETHMHIASGDDDLFVNSVADRRNVTMILEKDSFTKSEAKKNLKNFIRQKSRHLSTGTSYKSVHKVLLGMLAFSHLIHYVLCILLILIHSSTVFVFGWVAIRMGVILLVYASVLRKFQESSLLKWIPILDFLFIGYYLFFAPTLFISKTNKWK